MNIEEAKAKLEEYISIWEQLKCSIQPSEIKSIEIVLNELEKKNKVIDEMAEYIKKPYRIIAFGSRKPKIEIIKEYFYKKVEEK